MTLKELSTIIEKISKQDVKPTCLSIYNALADVSGETIAMYGDTPVVSIDEAHWHPIYLDKVTGEGKIHYNLTFILDDSFTKPIERYYDSCFNCGNLCAQSLCNVRREQVSDYDLCDFHEKKGGNDGI